MVQEQFSAMKQIPKSFYYVLAVVIVIAIIAAFIIRSKMQLSVVLLEPSVLDSISTNQTMKLQFQNLDEDEKNYIGAVFSPLTEYDLKWDSQVLLVTPKILEPDKEYKLAISITGTKLAEYTLHTKKYDELTNEEQELLRTNGIKYNAEKAKTILEEKPWLRELPIFNKNFNIIYDYDNKIVRIRVYRIPNINQAEEDSIKESALNELKLISIPTSEKVVFVFD